MGWNTLTPFVANVKNMIHKKIDQLNLSSLTKNQLETKGNLPNHFMIGLQDDTKDKKMHTSTTQT